MSVASGQTLAHYRLVEKIGEGGMGVVWKAVDTTLDRKVAIKVLVDSVATHPERLARFNREAKLLASLNHPNIASIYGFHESDTSTDSVRFVAMELVPGEDLAQRLEHGPVAVDEAIEIAEQIAAALTAAHDADVIHRDLKPANVRLTPDGTVKVLDFGLAKSLDADPVPGSTDPSASPTVTTGGTAFGVILGTPSYMSPEQARGRAVDRRADMWAFGCVLYELLTGQQVFEGETITDILSAVISREPDWDRLPPQTPAATRRLLRRCLQKKAAERVRDAADARLELAEADELTAAAPGEVKRGNPVVWILAALALVAVTWFVSTRILGSRAPATSDGLPTARQVTFTGDVDWFDLASDGRTAIYVTDDRRSVMLLDVVGGGNQTLYTAPASEILYDVSWSPDGTRVYLATFPYANKVLSIPRLGGEPRRELELAHLAGLNGISLMKLVDGNWLLHGEYNTLYIGPDPSGLEAQGAQLVGEGVFKIPGLQTITDLESSGDGRWLAFSGLDSGGRRRTGIASAGSGEAPGPIEAWSSMRPVNWSGDGRFLYLARSKGASTGDLLRVPIDPATGYPEEDPTLIYPRIRAWQWLVSGDGERLVFMDGDTVRNLREITLDGTRDASDNPARRRTGGTGVWGMADFLPDGDILAANYSDVEWELFAVSPDGSRKSVLRQAEFPTASAVSPDGSTLALAVNLESGPELRLQEMATGRSRSIDLPESVTDVDWSADGNHIAAMTQDSADHIVVVDVAAETAQRVQLDCGTQCEFATESITVGPDWPWAAVTSEVDTWIVNAETGALRHLAHDTWGVMEWVGAWVYFYRGGGQTDWPGDVLFRITGDGAKEERLLDLPLDCSAYRVAPDGRSLICALEESRVDLSVIELGADG